MKNKLLIVFILVGLLAGIVPVYGFSPAEDTVDIGLVFGTTTTDALTLKSEDGFEIGLSKSASKKDALLNLHNYKALTLYKLGGYVYNAQEPVFEPTLPAEKGTFTVAVDSESTDYQEVFDAFLALKAEDEAFAIGLSKMYRVYYGNYATEAEAEAAVSTLKVRYPTRQFEVEKLPFRYIGVYAGTELLTYVDTAESLALAAPLIAYNGVVYRNQMLVKRLSNSDLTLINRVSISEYLYGVVPKEVSPSWPKDALKAQAIAARNYLFTNSGKYAAYGFDVAATVSSQVYGGYASEDPRTNRAVDETSGEALYYAGALVECFYYAHSGGYTEDAANVWANNLPYIKAVEDPYGKGAPNDNWQVSFTREEIESAVAKSGQSIGTLKEVRIAKRTASGRAHEMIFVGDLGQVTLRKDAFRRYIGGTQLKSMLIAFEPFEEKSAPPAPKPTVEQSGNGPTALLSQSPVYFERLSDDVYKMYSGGAMTTVDLAKAADTQENAQSVSEVAVPNSNGEVTFYGKGYGHGVGMSQWGARKMAEMGFTYQEILAHYYNGAQVEPIQ